MDWLTAILAFATTMLLLSMIVTTLVETLHRIGSQRAKGLWDMLDRFYDDVIEKRLPKDLITPATRKEFMSKMMKNDMCAESSEKRPGFDYKGNCLTHLPVEMFMERLATTAFVQAAEAELAKTKEGEPSRFLQDIAQKFENFGLSASHRFEQKSRKLSIICAIVIAFLFYVNPYTLITSYLENPALAESVILKSDAAVEEAKEAREQLEPFTQSPNLPADELVEIKTSLEELNTAIQAAEKDINELAKDGVPLGWPKEISGDGTFLGWLKLLINNWRSLTDYIPTILWLTFGGLLVGLGSPFWAQAVTSLIKIRNVEKSVSQILNTGKDVTTTVLAQAAPANGTQHSTPIAAFVVSKAGNPSNPKPS